MAGFLRDNTLTEHRVTLDFLGIGAQKAGTTWLYTQLARHPEIRFPAGKEVHFWDRPHTPAARQEYLARFGAPAAGGVQGEITPAYALLPETVVGAIQACNPALRAIYLIRNPLERAWSAALMALGRAEMTPAEASDQWFSDHFHSAGSLARGDYERCLRRWRRVFPAEQLLVLRYEQINREPAALLNRCFRHLGVATQTPAQLAAWDLDQRVFAGSGEPLRPSLIPLLRHLYDARIRSLAVYLDTNLDSWLECP